MLKELKQIRASLEARGESDLRTQILQGRTSARPTHSVSELEILALQDSDIGRISRSWLRINYYVPGVINRELPLIDVGRALAMMAGYLPDGF